MQGCGERVWRQESARTITGSSGAWHSEPLWWRQPSAPCWQHVAPAGAAPLPAGKHRRVPGCHKQARACCASKAGPSSPRGAATLPSSRDVPQWLHPALPTQLHPPQLTLWRSASGLGPAMPERAAPAVPDRAAPDPAVPAVPKQARVSSCARVSSRARVSSCARASPQRSRPGSPSWVLPPRGAAAGWRWRGSRTAARSRRLRGGQGARRCVCGVGGQRGGW